MVVRCWFLGGWGMHAAFLPALETSVAKQISKAILLPDRWGQWCMGWGSCVKHEWKSPLSALDSVVFSPGDSRPNLRCPWSGVSSTGSSATFEDEYSEITLWCLRAWLLNECSGGYHARCSNWPSACMKPRLCVQSPYHWTCLLDSVSVLPLHWLCHCRVLGSP